MKNLLLFISITCVPATAIAREPLHVMLQSHCADCHDRDTTEGEFDLTELLSSKLAGDSRARVLARVRSRVEAGEMPPEDADELSSSQRQRLAQLVSDELEKLAESLRDDPGDVAMTRLTPYEYRNVIRDLSGGVVTDAGRLLPNEGGAGEGFSNVGEAQGMSPVQFEKYVEAARGALQHLRVYPLPEGGFVWRDVPRESVDDPKHATKEATDDIIAWHVAQQQKWGAEHRDSLSQKYGSAHAIYLEAAWRTRHGKPPLDEPLSPIALEKWTRILNDAKSDSPFIQWVKPWRTLPGDLSDERIRAECLAITTGQRGGSTEVNQEDYAPPYEISFHEAKEEVLEAATKQGHWPFRIEIGEAKELFLIVTDAGDGGQGEYAVWQKGRIVFRDGSSKLWQQAVQVVGANSGKHFEWGVDGEGSKVLGGDAIGVRPPGALKFAVPDEAIVFEVDLTLDPNRTKLASIQALVLKDKPKSQSYIPGRFVFGGRKRQVDAKREENRQRDRLLRLRNVAEANKTKIGLNAERNVFAAWPHTDLATIGGPWDEQEQEQEILDAPYHYTVTQVRRNATVEDAAELRSLEERLLSIAAPPDSSELTTSAETWIERFASRAWRRPLLNRERDLLAGLYRDALEQGVSFDSAVKASLLAVLVSPSFLYRGNETVSETIHDLRQQEEGLTRPLTSLELGSRLSFFLWSSLPDEELMQLAIEDKLCNSNVLREQARRMLLDPRARSLATDFAGQVWDFADFNQFTGPDGERFPEFTPALRQAMFDEVVTFLDDLFRNDRPLTALIDADYTFADAELLRHYGLEQSIRVERTEGTAAGLTEGPNRVKLPPERGGVATMGLFLTKTSLPLRTSPVQRGVWVAEKLLGREIPSPPADVPSISDAETSVEGLSVREQLQRHRASRTCAACHVKFDPLGVSLENFDALGRWRTVLHDGGEVANSDSMPDGREVTGAAGLRRYLVDHQNEVFAHFNRKLLGYALGRAVQPGDTALLERLNIGPSQNDSRFSYLVESIVGSPQFLMKKP